MSNGPSVDGILPIVDINVLMVEKEVFGKQRPLSIAYCQLPIGELSLTKHFGIYR